MSVHNPSVQVKLRTEIGGAFFESTFFNTADAVNVAKELCALNKPPRVFVCVGSGTYQEVALFDFVG